MNLELFFLLIAFFIALAISFLILLISLIFVTRAADFEKNSAYECGFNLFLRHVRSLMLSYLVSILFIILI